MADNDKSSSPLAAMVTLQSGEEMPRVLVNVLRTTLEFLLETNALVFYELVMSCRNPDHKIFGKMSEPLVDLGLVERFDANGCAVIRDYVRSIVLSSAEGDELQMRLVNPISN